MKIRRLVTLCALLGILIVSGFSASADEKLSGISTSLSNTTISGSVDSTVGGQIQPSSPPESRGWWRAFIHLFGFHVRS
jgi:hypothetical protein